MCGLALSELADYPWNMIGALASVASLLATLGIGAWVIRDVRRLDVRRKRVKRPGEAFFVIPAVQYHNCDHAHQNEYEHNTKIIILRADTVSTVDLVIKSLVDFDTDQVYLGVEDNNFNRPCFIEVYNRFITTGYRRQTVPGDGTSYDYIDKYFYYHFVEHVQWPEGENKALGFKIKTGKAGRYKLNIVFLGAAVYGRVDDLTIVVSKEPREDICCCIPAYMGWNCAVGIKPN